MSEAMRRLRRPWFDAGPVLTFFEEPTSAEEAPSGLTFDDIIKRAKTPAGINTIT